MVKFIFGLLLLTLVITFQNCSGVEFLGGSRSESVGAPSSGGGPSNAIDGTNAQLAQCFSYADEAGSGPCSMSLSQTQVLTSTNANGDYVIRVTFPTEFVDNTYGASAIGWGNRGHTFNDLVGSDHVILDLTDATGNLVMNVKLDYISEDKKNSGAFITGVEKIEVGNAADVLGVRTSLVANIVENGYNLTVDSPATDVAYTANPNYPQWIYEVWYEVTVSATAFQAGGGFGKVEITGIHASPSKISENTCEVKMAPCEVPIGNACEDNPDDPDDDDECKDVLQQRD